MSEIETKQMCPGCSNTEFGVYTVFSKNEKGCVIKGGIIFRCLRCGKKHNSLIDLVIL